MSRRILYGYLFFFVFMTGCATVQDKIALSDRITHLERNRNQAEENYRKLESELQKIGKDWDSKGQDYTGQYASMRAENRKLMEEIQILSGRIEEFEFTIGQMNAANGALEKKMEELSAVNRKAEKRILALEQYLGVGASPAVRRQPAETEPTRIESTVESASAPAPEPENGLYAQAKRAFDSGDFGAARTGFQKYISLFPKTENADNAQFWIGETYYREAWYEKAILEYEEVKKNYPKGNKIPSTLLKQGMAFQQLKENANARLILEELVNRFPKSNEAEIARKILKSL